MTVGVTVWLSRAIRDVAACAKPSCITDALLRLLVARPVTAADGVRAGAAGSGTVRAIVAIIDACAHIPTVALVTDAGAHPTAHLLTAVTMGTVVMAHAGAAVHGGLNAMARNLTCRAHPAFLTLAAVGHRAVSCTRPSRVTILRTLWYLTAPSLPATAADTLPAGQNAVAMARAVQVVQAGTSWFFAVLTPTPIKPTVTSLIHCAAANSRALGVAFVAMVARVTGAVGWSGNAMMTVMFTGSAKESVITLAFRYAIHRQTVPPVVTI